MTGQIPPYGRRGFRRESVPWTPDLANRIYVLTRDPAWFIRSDSTSEHWQVYHRPPGASLTTATAMSRPQDTFREAMDLLLDGIDRGFYPVTETEPSGRPEQRETR